MIESTPKPDHDTQASSSGPELTPRWKALLTRRNVVPLCLAAILVLGAVFRFTGVNWDDHTHLHPDERHVWMVTMGIELPKSLGEYFDSATSPLNPYNRGSSFVYGTLPLFLTKAVGEILDLGGGEHIHLVGRVLAACFDLITVFLMFFIGRKLYGVGAGLLCAFFAAFTVVNIQQAHFYTVDSFVVTFVVLTFFFALRVVERGSWSDFLWMGVSFGLAVASKINVALFGVVMGLACLLRIYYALRAPTVPQAAKTRRRHSGGLPRWEKVIGGVSLSLSLERSPDAEHENEGNDEETESLPVVPAQQLEPHWLDTGYSVALKFTVCLVVAFFAFRIAQPYSFTGPGFFDLKFEPRWAEDMRWVSRSQTGEIDYFPSHQWASRPAIIYSLKNMVLWLVGTPLGLASWAGWALAWYELWRKRKLEHVLALAWTTLFFFYQATRFVKVSRYLLPCLPFMSMLGAYLLVSAWNRARASDAQWVRRGAVALMVTVTVGTFLWAFAFTQIYTRPLTRVAASLWVYDNIPEGSAIGSEAWDDAIPWGGVGGRNGYAEGIYGYVEMHPYAEDVPEKWDWFVEWLDEADYIILSSNRLYGSVPRLPMRYPMTTRYYEYLFGGELGFELMETFTSRPNLGPIEFVDDDVDESLTVYDHPKVTVFRKTSDYDSGRVRSLLGDGIDWDSIARLKPVEVPKWNNGLKLTDEEKAAQQRGGTWSDIFNRESLSNAVPVIMWLLLVEVLGVVTLPLADVLFHSLADRGYALAKPLGVLLLTWLTWMLVNLGVMQYDRVAISMALLLMTACGALLFWRKRERLMAFWKEHRRLILINEAVFLLFFCLFLLIRYGNPDLWHPAMGGEKPMNLAHLNAVIKSSIFPPYDPWFAGGYLNYYYFGQIIIATLIQFTGIVPWVAYNLSIPLLAALTATGAFCVVYNLTHKDGADQRAWWQPAFLWSGLAALLVTVLGNLAEIGVVLKALMDLGTVEAKSSIPVVTSLARVLSGAQRWLTGEGKPSFRPEWWYWNASRVMPNGEINEFPFFTFLYADLHAHMIALPFALLILGLAVAVIRQRARKGGAGESLMEAVGALDAQGIGDWLRQAGKALARKVDWGEALLLGVMGLVVGAMRPINTWDYPTYLLVVGVALAIREYERRGRIDVAGLVAVGWRSGVVLALSYVFFLPFISRFATAYVSLERWKGPRTGLDRYLIIHGLFLWVIVSLMGVVLFRRESRQGAARMLRLAVRHWDRLPRLRVLYGRLVCRGRQYDSLGAIAAGIVVLLLTWLVKSGEWFYMFVGLLILGTLLIVLRRSMAPKWRFMWLLFGMGLAMSLGVDLFVLKGDIGRMNTVFKYYMQIWVMWSIVTAVSLGELAEHVRKWAVRRQRAWWGVMGVLLFLAALYPVLASRAKINDRFDRSVGPSLDGMAYMTKAVYHDGEPIELKWDRDAINWLLDNVEGSPVIMEGNTEERGLYRWGSRVSINTGLPAVIGWSWHERQQRSAMPGEWIDRRLNDVQRFYRDTNHDVALDILRKYDVKYVYVGHMERIYYPGPGLDKFEAMVAEGTLELVYENEQVRVYEVVAP